MPADDITHEANVDVRIAAQCSLDSALAKTAYVPTSDAYETFRDMCRDACEQGQKACMAFRVGPAAFQGVLITASDLESTTDRLALEGDEVLEAKGSEQIERDGEMHEPVRRIAGRRSRQLLSAPAASGLQFIPAVQDVPLHFALRAICSAPITDEDTTHE